MTALDEIRGRWEKVTPGPWETRTDDLTHDIDVVHDQEQLSFIASCGSKHGPRAHSDAVAIAHAPTDVARLLSAVEAALDLHKPVTVYEWDDDAGAFAVDESGEQIEVATLCRECSSETVMDEVECCEYDASGNYDAVDYPCPTVRAITSALEAGR